MNNPTTRDETKTRQWLVSACVLDLLVLVIGLGLMDYSPDSFLRLMDFRKGIDETLVVILIPMLMGLVSFVLSFTWKRQRQGLTYFLSLNFFLVSAIMVQFSGFALGSAPAFILMIVAFLLNLQAILVPHDKSLISIRSRYPSTPHESFFSGSRKLILVTFFQGIALAIVGFLLFAVFGIADPVDFNLEAKQRLLQVGERIYLVSMLLSSINFLLGVTWKPSRTVITWLLTTTQVIILSVVIIYGSNVLSILLIVESGKAMALFCLALMILLYLPESWAINFIQQPILHIPTYE